MMAFPVSQMVLTPRVALVRRMEPRLKGWVTDSTMRLMRLLVRLRHWRLSRLTSVGRSCVLTWGVFLVVGGVVGGF